MVCNPHISLLQICTCTELLMGQMIGKWGTDESAQRKCTSVERLGNCTLNGLTHAMFKTHSLGDYGASLQYLHYIQFLITR